MWGGGDLVGKRVAVGDTLQHSTLEGRQTGQPSAQLFLHGSEQPLRHD